jgi:hypothetical protein
MELLEDLNRKYRRYRHNPRERTFLGLNGLQPVLSSNVSAVGVKGEDLIIRFHNGSVYSYRNRATDYENILKSNSKGKWVWRFLRRANAFYTKLGVVPLPDDIGVTDEDIFQEIDNRYLSDLVQHVDVPVFQSFEFIKGINYQKIVVGDINVYKVITEPLPLAPTQPITVAPSVLEPIESIEWKQPEKITTSPLKAKNIELWQKDFDETVKETKLTPIRSKVLKLYKNYGDVYKDLNMNISNERAHYSHTNKSISVQNVVENTKKGDLVTYTHEIGHALDDKLGALSVKGNNRFYLSQLGIYDDIFDNPTYPQIIEASKQFNKGIEKYALGKGERYDKWSKDFDLENKKTYKYFVYKEQKRKEAKEKYKYIIENPTQKLKEHQELLLQIKDQKELDESLKKLDILQNEVKDSVKQYNELTSSKNIMQGKEHYDQVSDFYDALSNGLYFEKRVTTFGHGNDYYKKTGAKHVEIFTHLSTLSVYDQEVYDDLKQDFPEIVTAFEEMIDEVTKIQEVGIV